MLSMQTSLSLITHPASGSLGKAGEGGREADSNEARDYEGG